MKFVIKTVNGKFMSETFTMNGLDFETIHEADAKIFESEKEAEKFIDSKGIDKSFCYISEAESIKVDKSDYEIFDYANGYFGIVKKDTFGGEIVFGGDSGFEDNYDRDYMEYIYSNWDGTLRLMTDWIGHEDEYWIDASMFR